MTSHANCAHSSTRRAITACEAQVAPETALNAAARERRAADSQRFAEARARNDRELDALFAEAAMRREAAAAHRDAQRFTRTFTSNHA